ncbi:MAG: PASTA domain-containing protein [Actinomycetia bacterium]|nr:PASTA domain-containing protein [Actinomycetes bacterium]
MAADKNDKALMIPDDPVCAHVAEEKAASPDSDETAIDEALRELRRDNETSTLPDPTEAIDALAPEQAGDEPEAPMTGIFGVLERAQNAMVAANERLVEEAEEPPKSYRKLSIGLIIGGVIVLLLAAGFVAWQQSSRVRVPDLIGTDQSRAVEAINAAHLKVGRLTERATVTATPGTVIDQDPMVDVKVARGTAIDLTIATSSGQASVPSVLKMSTSDAATALSSARLVYSELATFSDTVPPGGIVGQLPVAGTVVDGGTKVYVLVSQGAATSPVAVPKVLGLSKADASKLLRDQGFTPLFYYAQTSFGATGQAVTQTPASTGQAFPGSVVMVLICQGNATSGMIVPDVTGKAEAEAKTALSNAGFNVDVRRIVTSSASAGTVVAQTPQAKDTRLDAGATVGLLVSAGSNPSVRLPSLLGSSLATAQGKLRSMGFDVVVVPLPKGQQPGPVTQQFPAGGLTYNLGLPVLLYAPQKG